MNPPTLHVRRHVSHVRAYGARAPRPPTGLVDELARLDLPRGDGIWFIQRLDVDAWWSAGTGGSAARVLAGRVVERLHRVLADGPDGTAVVWFPDRVSYLAQWLVDLAGDQAEPRWEYAELGGLHPVAQREPDVLLRALRRMPDADMDRLLVRLPPADAAALVHEIAGGGPDRPDLDALAGRTRSMLDAGRLPADARSATLALVARTDGPLGLATATAARDLAGIAIALRAAPATDRPPLATALAAGDWRTAARLGAGGLVPDLMTWNDADRGAALARLAPPAGAGSTAPPPDAHVPSAAAPGGEPAAYTALGGAFLLLPLLAELPFAAATAGWPPFAEVPPDRLPAALALAGALGADRAEALLRDRWLLTALGLPECPPADVARWSEEVGPEPAAALVAAFADATARHRDGCLRDRDDATLRLGSLLAGPAADALAVASSAVLRVLAYRLPGLATAGAAHLRRNVLDVGATVRPEPDRIVVELGAAPLDLLLSLTGASRRTFLLPATGNRPWLLTRP